MELGEGRSAIRVVGVHYPASWAVDLPPHAEAMRALALGWLRERGLVHDAPSLEKFERLAVGEYANWPFATATPERAEIITKFLALWIFYDDVIEERDDGRAHEMRAAIRGLSELPPSTDPTVAAWDELARAYARTMSRRWLDRHADRFADWMASVGVERAAALERRRTGAHPRAAEQLARRRDNIGMLPNLDFVEYQMGWELPDAVLADPAFASVERCASDAVAIVNDLFGFSKDADLDWTNLVGSIMHEHEVGPGPAFRFACELHDARIDGLVEAERTLLERHPDEQLLATWLEGVHHVVYGFARWHARAPRYRSTHFVGDEAIRVVIRTR